MKVAILGTGNIGTDLLFKVIKSKSLSCSLFAGRSVSSSGIKRARELGIVVSDRGINSILDDPSICDIVVDCTSAQDHAHHWQVCQSLGKSIIDLTPAKLGSFCVPAVSHDLLTTNIQNINMVTCGGQTSVPLAYALSLVHKDIEYVEVASTISSLSAGPATRRNLDEYIDTTQEALKKFSGAKHSKAILILNPANPPVYMQTTLYARIDNPDMQEITNSILSMIRKIQNYVPGYQLIVPPTLDRDIVSVSVKVLGAGDYLPEYAGNLDIINCAALEVLERIAKENS
jgi:acetaldehyde dehydrogenase